MYFDFFKGAYKQDWNLSWLPYYFLLCVEIFCISFPFSLHQPFCVVIASHTIADIFAIEAVLEKVRYSCACLRALATVELSLS